MTTIKITDRFIVHPAVLICDDFQDRIVIYHPLSDEAITTELVGAAILKALNGERDLTEVAKIIQSTFDDVPVSIQDDILNYCGELHRRLIIRKSSDGEK